MSFNRTSSIDRKRFKDWRLFWIFYTQKAFCWSSIHRRPLTGQDFYRPMSFSCSFLYRRNLQCILNTEDVLHAFYRPNTFYTSSIDRRPLQGVLWAQEFYWSFIEKSLFIERDLKQIFNKFSMDRTSIDRWASDRSAYTRLL